MPKNENNHLDAGKETSPSDRQQFEKQNKAKVANFDTLVKTVPDFDTLVKEVKAANELKEQQAKQEQQAQQEKQKKLEQQEKRTQQEKQKKQKQQAQQEKQKKLEQQKKAKPNPTVNISGDVTHAAVTPVVDTSATVTPATVTPAANNKPSKYIQELLVRKFKFVDIEDAMIKARQIEEAAKARQIEEAAAKARQTEEAAKARQTEEAAKARLIKNAQFDEIHQLYQKWYSINIIRPWEEIGLETREKALLFLAWKRYTKQYNVIYGKPHPLATPYEKLPSYKDEHKTKHTIITMDGKTFNLTDVEIKRTEKRFLNCDTYLETTSEQLRSINTLYNDNNVTFLFAVELSYYKQYLSFADNEETNLDRYIIAEFCQSALNAIADKNKNKKERDVCVQNHLNSLKNSIIDYQKKLGGEDKLKYDAMIKHIDKYLVDKYPTFLAVPNAIKDLQGYIDKRKKLANSSRFLDAFYGFFGKFSGSEKICAAEKMIKLISPDATPDERKKSQLTVRDYEALNDGNLRKAIEKIEKAGILPKEYEKIKEIWTRVKKEEAAHHVAEFRSKK